MKSLVRFRDRSLHASYLALADGRFEDKRLYRWIKKALSELQKDAYAGLQLKKKQIPPSVVQKYQLQNLWRYDLPSGWRLLYTIGEDKVDVVALVISWMSHKEYERFLGYTVRDRAVMLAYGQESI